MLLISTKRIVRNGKDSSAALGKQINQKLSNRQKSPCSLQIIQGKTLWSVKGKQKRSKHVHSGTDAAHLFVSAVSSHALSLPTGKTGRLIKMLPVSDQQRAVMSLLTADLSTVTRSPHRASSNDCPSLNLLPLCSGLTLHYVYFRNLQKTQKNHVAPKPRSNESDHVPIIGQFTNPLD